MQTRSLLPSLAALCLVAVSVHAGPEHKNLQVLPKTISGVELKKMMNDFTEQLGVKCTFCHVLEQYERDDRPHKADARRMLRMVLDLRAKKAVYFGARTRAAAINCGLCHRGAAEPEPYTATLLPSFAFLAPPAVPGARPKNLQVLAKTTTSGEVSRVMEGFTRDLGVKCDFCHGPESDKDDRPHKADARRMMKLTQDLKARKVAYFGPDAKDSVVTCALCHRGKAEPEPFVPAL